MPEKDERINMNQPINYPYDIVIKKMSELGKEFPDIAALHAEEFSEQKRSWDMSSMDAGKP